MAKSPLNPPHRATLTIASRRDLATPQQARATLEATLAIEYSMATGQSVVLPLRDKNFFVER